MTTSQAALVYCPFPDQAAARQAAQQLLSKKLIACANILPRIEAVFEWDGKASQVEETAVLFKTTVVRLEQVIEYLGEIHPYDTPVILGWKCDAALPASLQWLHEETQGNY